MGSAIMAALLALASGVVSSGVSAAEAPDNVGSWPADCQGALVRGRAPTLIWDDEIQKHGPDKLSSHINHPAFGLPERFYRDPLFQALDPQVQDAIRYEAWIDAFGGVVDIEFVTHYVTMPTGYTFERVVYDQGSGRVIVPARGKTIRDPGFGGLGVAWRVQDLKTGFAKNSPLWSATFPDIYTWSRANELCAQWGGRLPTIQEYEELVAQLGQYKDNEGATRLRELMGFKAAYYWLSSRDIPFLNYAYYVHGRTGQAGCDLRSGLNFAVRCVR